MVWIDKGLENFLHNNFKDRITKGYYEYRTWQSSRFVYVTTSLTDDEDLHYEYYRNHVELHLEGKYQSENYRDFTNELRRRTARNPHLSWHTWQGKSRCRCRIDGPTGSTVELLQTFKDIMSIIDPMLQELNRAITISPRLEAYDGPSGFEENGLAEDEVCLETHCLGRVFSNDLAIPDYQRNYCWEEKQLRNLWNSLKEIPATGQYHLGTIILQKVDEKKYNVIDGQQRLVTLTIILSALGYQGPMPLLSQSFHSLSSKAHIASNKWIVNGLCNHVNDGDFCWKLINNLYFSILILKGNRLDLAYAFFSNQNAKGVALSDFDLLKAHHLRFIPTERQQEHLVGRWNNLIESHYWLLDDTLSTHLFRLRKWMRKKDYDVNEPHRVKEEYSAALVIPDIPPFGERFDFYEKIQGGAHFFAYAEKFVDKFALFEKTPQVQSLRNHLKWESHWRYESVIESLLFGYYLKFGNQYLTEALISIAENIAQHRYTSSRAIYYKILEYAKDSEIIMMIDQSSSPTFFLRECKDNTSISGKDIDGGIQMRFYMNIEDVKDELYTLCDSKLQEI